MSIADDDTVLRQSELEQMRAVTLGEDTDAEPAEPSLTVLLGRHGPARLGHYVLLSKLGQGGMGMVYAAYDERLDRKVALKLLRGAENPQARKRLVREAQSMARLSHPNVVQIYEIGETAELTFLVMEFVNGDTLRGWLSAKRRSQQEILEVFIAAGRGLAAAHAQGLVHRDFKPDNVMIRDDDGRVLVMDFGLAHVGGAHVDEGERGASATGEVFAEPSGLTATGVLMGTPAYMAPEQFEGRETDPRTDQFSFCVALYEALHGSRPFAGTSVFDLSLAVCSGSMTMPEHSEVPAWLRKLLMRGLEVDPDRRWPSLELLLDALGRDPTRRRRAWLLGSAAVATLIALLAGVQLVHARARAKLVQGCEEQGQALGWNEAVEARLAQAFAATGLGYAPSAWAHTRELLDAYARSWTQTRTETCIEAELEHRRDEATYAAIRGCLDERRATFEGLLEAWAELDEQTLARATWAAAKLSPVSACTTELGLLQHMQAPAELQAKVSELRWELDRIKGLEFTGKYDEALAQLQPLLEQAERLQWRPLVVELRLVLGSLHNRRGEYEAARKTVEAAYAEAVGAGHDSMALVSSSLLAAIVGDKLAEPERGLYWGELGSMYVERLGLRGSSREAQLLDTIGTVHYRAGDYERALAAHERALEIIEAELGPDHLHVAVAINNAGNARWRLGDHEQALASFHAALRIKQAVLGDQHPEVATALNNIGAVQWGKGDYDAAEAAFRQALALREAALGPRHPDVAGALGNLGAVLASQGESSEALVAFDRALDIQEATLGPEHPDLAGALINVGNILRKQGKHQEALEAHRRAAAIWEAALGPEHPNLALALNNVGIVLWQVGELDEARSVHGRALAIREAALGPEHPDVAMSLDNLAEVASSAGELDEALALLERALAIREAALGPEHPDVADTLDSLGDVQRERGELEQSLAAHRRALSINEAAHGPDNPNTAYALHGLGRTHVELGAHDEARAELERALAIRERTEATPGELAAVRFALAQVLGELGEQQRARELAEAARPGLLADPQPGRPTVAEVDAWLAKH